MTANAADNRVVVHFYWRPGCGFCKRLDRHLEAHDLEIDYHNIWEDSEAAATVRSIANGNETVPTIVIGTEARVNPPAQWVLDAVERAGQLRPAPEHGTD